MPRKRSDKRSQRASRTVARVWKWAAALIGALAIAFATAIGTGLGSQVTGGFSGAGQTTGASRAGGATTPGGASALLSYSAQPEIVDCGTQLFIPGQRASSGRLPFATAMHGDWASVLRRNGGSVASPSITTVSIQGVTSRPITLTDMQFTVTRRPRPTGGIYGQPCGGPGQGRFVAIDLDQRPVRVLATSADPTAVVDVTQRPKQPIRFPWTVSLTDPLTLSVVATTKRCYCVWRASISWQSGARTGVLRIDDHGRGFVVVGPNGAPGWLAGNRRWGPFKYDGGPPRGGGD